MPRFGYEAQTASGDRVEGKVEAPDISEAAKSLKNSKLLVLRLTPDSLSALSRSKPAGRISAVDISAFAGQLASITKLNLPLPQALSELAKDAGKGRLSGALDKLASDVAGGMDLADALDRQPKSFPSLLSGMVRAGQASGNLPAA